MVMRFFASILCAVLAAAVSFGADFTITEKSEITGGALAGAMKMAARLSKQVDLTTTTTQHYKGGKMATVAKDSTQIVDADAETITFIDHDKKQYSVITFAEMAQAMEKMMQKMGQKGKKDSPDAEIKYSFNVERTGKKKQVAGVDAEQMVMVITMQATDKKSGESGNFDLVVDSWMGEVPGSQAVQEFSQKMAAKMGHQALAYMKTNPFMQQQGMGQGMAELSKKMQEMKGMPLLQITRFTGAGQTAAVVQAAKGEHAGQPFPQQQREGPSVKEAAGAAAVGSVLGGLGGGLGRFGRRKQQKEEPPQPKPSEQAGAAAPPGVMMEMVTQVLSYSSTPVDPAILQVPAGYKQVEHEMKKMLK